MLTNMTLVALGGAVGSLLRYLAALMFGASPTTTMFVNVLGSLLLGFLVGFSGDMRLRLLLGTGLLGGFTTFSTWQLEALQSIQQQGLSRQPAWIVFGSVAVGLGACWVGSVLGERLRP